VSNPIKQIDYSSTHSFSKLAIDYIAKHPIFSEWQAFEPSLDGIDQAIAARNNFSIDRTTLVSVLKQQYSAYEHDAIQQQIDLLQNEQTFTVCTAHQPNLLTGPIYFLYKIAHTIALANHLNKRYPQKKFVPVYYMGSEDNDWDELAHFNFNQQTFTWDYPELKGAFGRAETKHLTDILKKVGSFIGPSNAHTDHIKDIITKAYANETNISNATQSLVHALFGEYGLLVFNPDNRLVKEKMIPLFEKELLERKSFGLCQEQSNKINAYYPTQANPRPINLFYLNENGRNRIEWNNDQFTIVNTSLTFSQEQILKELYTSPERFSTNVITRGLLQETWLPNIAFIGGGAEIAYWLQLKPIFNSHNIFYPPLLLRQSYLLINTRQQKKLEQLGLNEERLFNSIDTLITHKLKQEGIDEQQFFKEEWQNMQTLLDAIAQKAQSIDPTLKEAAAATKTKIDKQVVRLQQKMLRAEKRKLQTYKNQVAQLKAELFPGNQLQERYCNFLDFYGSNPDLIKNLIEATQIENPLFNILQINN
jgi:bacillithiol biosynthesis cysteine-adding enzyme BshC